MNIIDKDLRDSIVRSFDFSHIVEILKDDAFNTLAQYRRPSVIYRPKVYIDGDQWCALYGEDIQSGVAGFGSSPCEAMIDFDLNWSAKLKAA